MEELIDSLHKGLAFGLVFQAKRKTSRRILMKHELPFHLGQKDAL